MDNEETAAIVKQHFWGIWPSIVTLMQFVTLDSVAAIYYPIIAVRPFLSILDAS